MSDACFADGTPQPLYFPEGHKHAGIFKGTAKILEERGFADKSIIRAECKYSTAHLLWMVDRKSVV